MPCISTSGGPTLAYGNHGTGSEIKLGKPIWIHIVLKSVSKEPFTIPETRQVGLGEMNYRISVVDADGNAVPDTERGRRLRNHEATGGRSVTILELKDGNEITDDANLNNVVNIPAPGNYVVQVERSDPRYADLHVKSNELTIHVTQ